MQGNAKISPRIIDYSWGRIKIQGYEREFKDVKLFPGGAREWNWNETGTGHHNGIQPEDFEELIDNGSEIIIISKGMLNRLRLSKKAEELLQSWNIVYFYLNTKKAIEKYNSLIPGKYVGALIHTTC